MTEHVASRTLVKSPPELWAECSDAASLARHLDEFGEIRITRLEPETAVAWEGERARGTVRIEPSGWGTKVILTAVAEEGEVVEQTEAVDPVDEAEPIEEVESPEVAEAHTRGCPGIRRTEPGGGADPSATSAPAPVCLGSSGSSERRRRRTSPPSPRVDEPAEPAEPEPPPEPEPEPEPNRTARHRPRPSRPHRGRGRAARHRGRGRAARHRGRAHGSARQPRSGTSPPVLARLGVGALAREHGAGLALDLPWRPSELRDQG